MTLLAQRDPIITAVTLDLLSGGRFLFGIGIGWNREEMENHGTNPKTRAKLTEERLETMQALWAREFAEYDGEFVNLEPSYAWPKSVQRPHPPHYFGGGPAAFPRIARFGAAWFAVSTSTEEITASMAQLHAVTGTANPVTAAHVGPVTEQALRGYTDTGVERVVLELPTLNEDQTMAKLTTSPPSPAPSAGNRPQAPGQVYGRAGLNCDGAGKPARLHRQ